MIEPVVKEGWLYKGKVGRFAHWKKRWFVLEFPFLKYYTSPKEKQLKGLYLCTLGSDVSITYDLIQTPSQDASRWEVDVW